MVILIFLCLCSGSSGSARDCHDLFVRGQRTSGVYTIQPESSRPFNVLCEMTSGESTDKRPEIIRLPFIYPNLTYFIVSHILGLICLCFQIFLPMFYGVLCVEILFHPKFPHISPQKADGLWSRNVKMDLRASTSCGRATREASATWMVSVILSKNIRNNKII